MVLEIALGIVLAYIIITMLPLIIAGGVLVITVAAVVLASAAAIYNWKVVLLVLGGLLTLALALGVPYTLGLYLTRRYPTLKLAIDGKEPFHEVRKLPHRLALMIPFVLVAVVLGLSLFGAGATGVGLLGDYLDGAVGER
jgi:hypothetical protein